MPRKVLQVVYRLLPLAAVLCLGGAVWAGPNTPSPSVSPGPAGSAPAAKAPIPDYGGRNGSLGATLEGGGAGAASPDPLGQAGRAFEALIIVLVVVTGGLALLKRSGLLKGSGAGVDKGRPAPWESLLSARGPGASRLAADGLTEMLTLLGSQTLPQSPGAVLHLVSVGGRVLLLGATAQSVAVLTEVAEVATSAPPNRDTPEEVAAFADYLARVGMSSPVTAGASATQATLAAATDRLQSLLAQGESRRIRN